MARKLSMMLLLWFALPAWADDLKVTVLEQEVRDLKRQVQTLTRQVDELRNRPAQSAGTTSQTRAPAASGAAGLPSWVDAAKWRKLRRGMSELEVIGSLGSPTSMREEDGAKILLYAMEVGASGFLGGSVSLRDRAVTEIREPELQ